MRNEASKTISYANRTLHLPIPEPQLVAVLRQRAKALQGSGLTNVEYLQQREEPNYRWSV